MIHAAYRYYSTVLGRMTGFHAILPRPQSILLREDRAEQPRHKKCLWFFHGVGDCGEDVLLHTHIGDLADQEDLVVVLPDLENSFCLDLDDYMRYETYLAEELIPMTLELLPVSSDREDRFLGGISMGGYGALRLALLHPELSGKLICLSGALDLRFALRFSRVCGIALPAALSGNPDLSQHPDWDLTALLERVPSENVPALYFACGARDMFLRANTEFCTKAAARGLSPTFSSVPGDHDWDFWRNSLPSAVAWLVQ